MKKIAIAVLLALAALGGAQAQTQYPQTLPSNSVWGRTGIGSGPGQAIPFAIFTGNLLQSLSAGNLTCSASGICAFNDTSEVIGSGAKKFNPLFFGNAGTALVHRFNRIFCGEATASSSDIGPVTTKDWLETLIPNTTGAAEFVCVDTVGQLGVVGASRSGDFRTAFGSATGGAQGVTGIGYNNDVGAGGPIAVGMNAIGVMAPGVSGITAGYQADLNNAATATDIVPFTALAGGNTIAGLFTSGAYTGVGTTNVSAAWVVNLGRIGGPLFRKGGVCMNGALDATVGAGGDGVCLEMARNQSIRWLNSTPTTDAEMWGAASGLVINSQVNFGVAGSTLGKFTVNGNTSGTITMQPQAAAGTYNWNWPTTAGASGQLLTSGGGGAAAMTWTDIGAFSAFTPSLSCGTATFTVNRAVSKTLGKTTNLTLDFTITAIGTCTTAVTFTLPNTANGSASIPAQEYSVNHEIAGCLNAAASTTSTCNKRAGAAFLVNERWVFTGAYDNQ
jgi:hypothetical protein